MVPALWKYEENTWNPSHGSSQKSKSSPYVIPGRTGTQLLPQDIAVLHQQYPNVSAVKEATGDLENMRLTRKLCGADFNILSGDDDKTYAMMTAQDIAATGVISVTSNIAPRAVADLTHYILDGNITEANNSPKRCSRFFAIVTVKTQEQTPYGTVASQSKKSTCLQEH